MALQETEDIYRLYRKEWLIVHSFSGVGDMDSPVPLRPFVEQAQDWAQRAYAGRVPERDIQYEAHTDNVNYFWVHVKVLLYNLKGEFKQAFLAQRHAEKQGWDDYEIVARNSRRDHELCAYGTKKIT